MQRCIIMQQERCHSWYHPRTMSRWNNTGEYPRPVNIIFVNNQMKKKSNLLLLSSTRSDSSSTGNNNINPWMTTYPASFVTGTVAGLLGSLAGMGGGFVMIPMMTSRLLNLTQHQAHGTSLFAVMLTGIAGAISYSVGSDGVGSGGLTHPNSDISVINTEATNNATTPSQSFDSNHHNIVRYDIAGIIAMCGMITARYGAMATQYFSQKKLKRSLGVLMLCMAPAIPIKSYILQQAKEQQQTQQQQSTNSSMNVKSPLEKGDGHLENKSINNYNMKEIKEIFSIAATGEFPKQIIAPALIGLCSGFLAGLFGVGGGVLVVPAVTICCGNDENPISHYSALGTSLTAMILPAAAGTYTHSLAKNVVMKVAPCLGIGALLGAYVGGQISLHTNESLLQYGFSSLLLTLGIRTLLKA